MTRAAAPPAPRLVIKDELCARVEVCDSSSGKVVRKTYRDRPFLLWRTFLRRARAGREFRNLSFTRDAGIPCVEPRDWGETRRLGCVPSSWLETGYVEDAIALSRVIRAMDPMDHEALSLRRRLAKEFGTLIRSLHQAGIVWGTLTTRNLLLVQQSERPRLLACDMPRAMRFGRSVLGTRRALVDLFNACFSPTRCREFSRSDRCAMLLCYCGGSRAELRRLWRALHGRSRWRNRAETGTLLAVYSLLTPLRGKLAPREFSRRSSPEGPPRRTA
ncbi:MAG: lipopolysaccharide kinase InaA family protein [Planctomycetota bacterium]